MSKVPDSMLVLARQVREKAPAPYSKFQVGAVVRTLDGQLFAGCNVENAAYPEGWCAETSAIAAMVAAGHKEIAEVVVLGGDGKVLCTPCGGCRQRIHEFATAETEIHVCGPEGLMRTYTLAELLPNSFGSENLK